MAAIKRNPGKKTILNQLELAKKELQDAQKKLKELQEKADKISMKELFDAIKASDLSIEDVKAYVAEHTKKKRKPKTKNEEASSEETISEEVSAEKTDAE